MVTLYVRDRCAACIKAKKWLQENNIPFIERNIISDPLTFVEFKEILRLTDNGTGKPMKGDSPPLGMG
jgi:regulatory protein spx